MANGNNNQYSIIAMQSFWNIKYRFVRDIINHFRINKAVKTMKGHVCFSIWWSKHWYSTNGFSSLRKRTLEVLA